ncbi:MAG: HEAT repeat domain-containing protein [Deltaproteobacteria bacterium]|nr:HEAT repeat domain-containing protein [Deltaproteobacteria bacterium]
MQNGAHQEIARLLASKNPDDLRVGLDLVKEELARADSKDARALFEIVSAIFYIDALDNPQFLPIIEEAINLVAGFGDWVIPVLIENLDTGDLKAQLAIAQALGMIGADAIDPLIAQYRTLEDPSRRAFVVYAIGKIKSPQIARAVPLALESARSQDRELRDTATRAIGKLAESIEPGKWPQPARDQCVNVLTASLADTNSGIRAKAIRSLGKMAKFEHLHDAEKKKLETVCLRLLGKDEHFEWDRAYIVRKEAELALSSCR